MQELRPPAWKLFLPFVLLIINHLNSREKTEKEQRRRGKPPKVRAALSLCSLTNTQDISVFYNLDLILLLNLVIFLLLKNFIAN